MKDEEKAEEYCNNEEPFDTTESGEKLYTENDLKYAYLAGLKTARQEKWHDLRKDPNDLPLNTDPVLCLGSTGFIVCKYISRSWVDNQKIESIPKYIEIYKWCEIEDTEE